MLVYKEVEENFLDSLTSFYTQVSSEKIRDEISILVDHITKGDVNSFLKHLQTTVFPSIYYDSITDSYHSPYYWERLSQRTLHNLLFLVSRLMANQTPTKLHVHPQRTSMTTWTSDSIYQREFVADSTPQKAIKLSCEKCLEKSLHTEDSIEEKPVKLIGVNYSTSECNITGWITTNKKISIFSKD